MKMAGGGVTARVWDRQCQDDEGGLRVQAESHRLRVAFQSSIVDLVLSKQCRNHEDEEHEWAASYRSGRTDYERSTSPCLSSRRTRSSRQAVQATTSMTVAAIGGACRIAYQPLFLSPNRPVKSSHKHQRSLLKRTSQRSYKAVPRRCVSSRDPSGRNLRCAAFEADCSTVPSLYSASNTTSDSSTLP